MRNTSPGRGEKNIWNHHLAWNKALRRPSWGIMMNHNPLRWPYFLGGGGGTLRFPWFFMWKDVCLTAPLGPGPWLQHPTHQSQLEKLQEVSTPPLKNKNSKQKQIGTCWNTSDIHFCWFLLGVSNPNKSWLPPPSTYPTQKKRVKKHFFIEMVQLIYLPTSQWHHQEDDYFQ